MTREEARKAAEIMMAYAEGKEIEYYDGLDECWESSDDLGFNWLDTKYRVKPEPKYRPFKNAEECWDEMLKHQPYGWLKHGISGELIAICGIDSLNKITIPRIKAFDMGFAFNTYIFADGTPFGVKED